MNLLFQNILQALRALRTQTWQVVVSALGLAVSIVCLSFSVNWLWSETNYDAFRPDYKDLYVLQRTDSLNSMKVSSCNLLQAEQVIEVLRQHGDSAGAMSFGANSIAFTRTDGPQQMHYFKHYSWGAAMLRTLGVEVLYGDINKTLNPLLFPALESTKGRDWDAYGAALEAYRHAEIPTVVTDRMAMQLFGRTDVVGEVLYNPKDKVRHPIGAVIKANEGKTNFPYDCIMAQKITDFNGAKSFLYQIVVRSKDIEATMRALEGIKSNENGEQLFFKHTPLRTYSMLYGSDIAIKQKAQGDFLRVYFYQLAFVTVSLLLLLSALANLIAVNTSICLSRTREYALRRSLGGSTWQNAQWLLTGIVPTLLLSVAISAIAWEWMLRMQWVEIDEYCATRIFWLVVLAVLVCSLLGMLYPIIKMHRIYKRSFAGSGSMGHSHGWLVAVQCVACAFLLFLSWGMSRQLNDLMNKDMGMDTHNLLRLHTGINASKEIPMQYSFGTLFYTLPQEFKRHSGEGIVDAVAVRTDIFNRTTGRGVIIGSQKLRDEYVKEEQDKWVEQHGSELLIADYVEMEYSVPQFFKLRTAGGREMDTNVSHEASYAQAYGDKQFMDLVGRDASKREPLFIIDSHNGSYRGYAVKTWKWGRNDHWPGQELYVIDEADLHTMDFHQQHNPTIYVGLPDGHDCNYSEHDAVYIRYAEGRLDDAEAAVRQVLKDMDVPEGEYELCTFEEYMAKSYKEDMFYARLVGWLTAFSFLITLAGVFSTLLYTLRLQRRSLAIRRVMGAEFRDVFMGTLRPYVIYAVLGAAVAFAPALLLMRKWMSYFTYGTAPGIGLMLCILLLMLTIITLIVLWQVNKSMNEKPIDVLRPEA